MKLLTLPRSGSHLMGVILKCSSEPTIKAHYEWMPEERAIEIIESPDSRWFHYPYTEKVAMAFQESQVDKYLLLRDPRAIIVSWAHYCEEPDGALDFVHKEKYLHTYPLEDRIDLVMDVAKDLFWDYEKWRQSGMFTVLRYRDILFNPLARVAHTGFRLGTIDSYKEEMTPKQLKKSTEMYKELIERW